MSKVVAFISGGVVQYVGSDLENVEIVVVDADNLSEMGYSDDDIQKILERETKGVSEKEIVEPTEASELMDVVPYQAPEPWKPEEGKWCWEEVEGMMEFKLAKFSGHKEGCNYYKFDGVLPMAEVLNQKERIDPQSVIAALKETTGQNLLSGDYWQNFSDPVPDAPDGFSVNVWDNGHNIQMTAYARIKSEDGQLRTSTLHPLMNYVFDSNEVKELLAVSMKGMAANAGNQTLEDALGQLNTMKSPKAFTRFPIRSRWDGWHEEPHNQAALGLRHHAPWQRH